MAVSTATGLVAENCPPAAPETPGGQAGYKTTLTLPKARCHACSRMSGSRRPPKPSTVMGALSAPMGVIRNMVLSHQTSREVTDMVHPTRPDMQQGRFPEPRSHRAGYSTDPQRPPWDSLVGETGTEQSSFHTSDTGPPLDGRPGSPTL